MDFIRNFYTKYIQLSIFFYLILGEDNIGIDLKKLYNSFEKFLYC